MLGGFRGLLLADGAGLTGFELVVLEGNVCAGAWNLALVNSVDSALSALILECR